MRFGAESIAASIRSSRFEVAAEALALLVRWNEEDALPEGHLHHAFTESARGQIAYFKLDYAKAREHLRGALAIFEKVGTRADVHITLFHLSSAHFYDDQFALAERCVAFVNEPVADPLCHARGHHRLAELAAMRDDLESAIAHEVLTRDLCDGQDAHWQLIVHMNLASCYVAAGRVDDAVAALARAQSVVDAVGDRRLKQELVHAKAVVDASRGEFAVARLRAVRWRDALAARGDKWQLTAALSVMMLCTAALGDGDLDEAVDAFVTAYDEAAHDEAITWWCIRGAAGWLRERGRTDLAERLTRMFDARLAHIKGADR
jgi:tetratricopeptide (TPR) repeat protein